jgi:FkbM family methyltransferase
VPNFNIQRRFKQLGKLTHLLANKTFLRGLSYGVGAAIEHKAVIESLALTTLVDVGANVGQFSLLAVGLNPRVRVHAFEPVSKASAVFERVFAGNSRVTLHKMAIGRHAETHRIGIARRHDSSSFLPPTKTQTTTFPGTDNVQSEIVQVVPLDFELDPSAIQPPALLKLDVQGYEMHALEGCEKLLPLFKYVYLEVSFAEFYVGQPTASKLFEYLLERGFAFEGVYNCVYDERGVAAQSDCLFARNQ